MTSGKARPTRRQLRERLVLAIINEDEHEVGHLLRCKVAVNFRLRSLGQDLVWQVVSCVDDQVGELVDSWTPLHLACYLGNCEIARMLISSTARIKVKDDIGKGPFDYAPDNVEFRELRMIVDPELGDDEDYLRDLF